MPQIADFKPNLTYEEPGNPVSLTGARHWLGALFGALSHPARRGWKGRIEALGPSDTVALILHTVALSASGRSARFNARTGYDTIERHYRQIDWQTHRLLGARAGRRLIAVAELAPAMVDGRPALELGLSVLEPWQGRGIGARLLVQAIRQANRDEGLPLVLFTSVENRAMVALARRFGAQGTLLGHDYRFVFAPEQGVSRVAA